MKLTFEQKKKIKESWEDWEAVHIEYDRLIETRLKELDFEFYKEMQEVIKGATFWYA